MSGVSLKLDIAKATGQQVKKEVMLIALDG